MAGVLKGEHMSEYANDVGRDYAALINAAARDINGAVAERKRLIMMMEASGWMIFTSRREEGKVAQNYAPIINSIKRMKQTVLEIEEEK